MKKLLPLVSVVIVGIFVLLAILGERDDGSATVNNQDQFAAEGSIQIPNEGGNFGGHTPRGFQGQGSGIFVGDNLNPGFPNGDGVQAFLTFDIRALQNLSITGARLFSNDLHITGSPFEDLGNIIVDEVRYDVFSSNIWNTKPVSGSGCTLGSGAQGETISCDISGLLIGAIQEGQETLQLRLQFETISDSDNAADLALFYKTNSNTNDRGVFTIEIAEDDNIVATRDIESFAPAIDLIKGKIPEYIPMPKPVVHEIESLEPVSSSVAPSSSGVPSGLSLPFRVGDIDEQNGEINPVGVVRFSQDQANIGHSGLDVPLFFGAEIRAVNDGEIVLLDSAGDPWGGEKIFQLLQGTSPGEGWAFIYEHVTIRSDLKVGSIVKRGEIIATKTAPAGFTAHLQLSYLFNGYQFIRDIQCWTDNLQSDDKSTLDSWWNTYRTSSHLVSSWNSNIEEGQYPFRGFLDEVIYSDGLQLCYPLGTDVR